MEFKITFYSIDGGNVVDVPGRQTGWRDVDTARVALNKDVQCSEITSEIPAWQEENVTITIPEETARKCRFFEYRNEVTVSVADGGLNPFVTTTATENPDGTVAVVYTIDTTKLLKYWGADGCPIFWFD